MRLKYISGGLAMLGFLAGCVTHPVTSEQMREYVHANKFRGRLEKFEVQRPYAAVTQHIKKKSEDCLNKIFQIAAKMSGTFATSVRDDGMTKYIPVSNIGPNSAEFYTKHWDSKARSINTPAGDKWIFYVADVTPQGCNTTSIDGMDSPRFFASKRMCW